jgi:hypothetical protein
MSWSLAPLWRLHDDDPINILPIEDGFLDPGPADAQILGNEELVHGKEPGTESDKVSRLGGIDRRLQIRPGLQAIAGRRPHLIVALALTLARALTVVLVGAGVVARDGAGGGWGGA